MKRDKDNMIRFFRDNDIDQLYELIQETITISYSSHYPNRAVQFFKNYHSKENIKKRNELGKILVIEQVSKIVATGSLVNDEISGVFILPDHQKAGLGKIIMTKLESIAKENGISEIRLHVSLPSRGFYQELKYEISEQQKIDVGEGQYLEYWSGKKKIMVHPTKAYFVS